VNFREHKLYLTLQFVSSVEVRYKGRRAEAENGVNLLSVRYGTVGLCTGSKRAEAFSEAISHLNLLSTKNETPEKS
jgi:hypothetical protein